MKWQQFIIDVYRRMSKDFEDVLDGLTIEELHRRPADGANPIGWLCWHATRSLDRTVGDVIWGEQYWIKEKWHARFGRSPDPNDTGYGHTDAEVDSLNIPDVRALLDYHHTVMGATITYLENLSEDEFDRECIFSVQPGSTRAVYLRLIANIRDTQHIGQAAYVRGLIKGHRWSSE
jgi:hypothetical protein